MIFQEENNKIDFSDEKVYNKKVSCSMERSMMYKGIWWLNYLMIISFLLLLFNFEYKKLSLSKSQVKQLEL